MKKIDHPFSNQDKYSDLDHESISFLKIKKQILAMMIFSLSEKGKILAIKIKEKIVVSQNAFSDYL